MSTTCLAIAADSRTAERASLLALYLVGLQWPLSGNVLALPEIVSRVTRPFIAADWGWSGYLKSFETFQQYDVVKQATSTSIAPAGLALLVLAAQALGGFLATGRFVPRTKRGG